MIIGIGRDCCERGAYFGCDPATWLPLSNPGVYRRRACRRRETAGAGGLFRQAIRGEACLKALGSGITPRIGWRDVEILNGPKGRPTLRLSGGALNRLARLIPKGHEPILHVSLADDPPMALAFVVVEARVRA